MRKLVLPELVTGVSARGLVGQYATNLGLRRVLLVTDPGVARAGWADEAEARLTKAGSSFVRFAGVSPNPRATEVTAGVARFLEGECDGIVAVGGGSPIDTAKGVAIEVSHGRSILAFEGVDLVESPIPPLVCVPTTAGTSADVSQFAIITDLPARRKVTIISKAIVPDVSLVDPVTTHTAPAHLTACTGMDAFTHAIEAFTSTANSALTDLTALDAIARIAPALPRVMARLDDAALRAELMLASLEAGVAFSNASLGVIHAMAHAVGGYYDCTHGEANALLLEAGIAFNYPTCPDRFDVVAERMGLSVSARAADARLAALLRAVHDLRVSVDLGGGLARLGARREDLPRIARETARDPCLVTNPRPATEADIEALLEQSL